MEQFAWFLVGMAAGVAWYRAFIRDLIRKNPCTMCDYCEFEIMKEQILKKDEFLFLGWRARRGRR